MRRLLRFLHEHSHDHDALWMAGDVEGASDAARPLQPHLPQLALDVINVEMANSLETVALDQRPNAHEVRPLLFGKLCELLGGRGRELDSPHLLLYSKKAMCTQPLWARKQASRASCAIQRR